MGFYSRVQINHGHLELLEAVLPRRLQKLGNTLASSPDTKSSFAANVIDKVDEYFNHQEDDNSPTFVRD